MRIAEKNTADRKATAGRGIAIAAQEKRRPSGNDKTSNWSKKNVRIPERHDPDVARQTVEMTTPVVLAEKCASSSRHSTAQPESDEYQGLQGRYRRHAR